MHPIDHLNHHMDCEGSSWKSRWVKYYEPVESISNDLPAPILGVMLLIWQLRDADLQKMFSLDTIASRCDFLSWCVYHGRREYKALAEAANFWNLVSEKMSWEYSLTEKDPGQAISIFMLLIKNARKDLPFDLNKVTGRAEFVLWYLIHGCHELGINTESMSSWQLAFFDSPSHMFGLNCLQMIVYQARADLQDAFSLPEMKEEYINWYNIHFLNEAMCAQLRLISHESKKIDLPLKLFKGVNVIGYALGQLGIGEDARMATKALTSAKINTALINFPPGKNIPQNDQSMTDFICSDIVYNVNIFCLTALETARYFLERGSYYFSSTYNIGYWPWELEEWPSEWNHLFSLIDEAWASSMHTYRSIFSYSDIPVKHVPMAVAIPRESKLIREDFGLPPCSKLFLFSFDLNSSAKRKNPNACVEAFLTAFPLGSDAGCEDIRLVIKAHPPTQFNAEWEKLLSLSKEDTRIHIIQSTLSKEDLLALYKICDCFVSLHRAEGFGRNIAESMLLGTPVIATAYSGNLDYTNHKNAYLVEFRSVLLEDGDYPYGNGKFWAEPDISQAAQKMRAVFENPAEFRSISYRARQEIKNKYNFSTVGARYLFELENIWSKIPSNRLMYNH